MIGLWPRDNPNDSNRNLVESKSRLREFTREKWPRKDM
jgi:hypothetical protein